MHKTYQVFDKNDINISVGQEIDQNMQNIVLINNNNSRIIWSAKILNAIFEFLSKFASGCL